MKKNLILFLLCLFLVPAFAQKSKKDMVYLKSGAIVKGDLITHDADIVKINSAGNFWVFKNSEVDSISRYSKKVSESNRNKDLSLIHISEPTRLGMISY